MTTNRNADITRHGLNYVMEFDHVIEVADDGTVTDAPAGIYAPTLTGDSATGTEELDSPAWSLMSAGYTGQYGYHGPVMHNSEYIGGRLARDIMATAGYYVAVYCTWMSDDDDDDDTEDTVEGWAVAYRPVPVPVDIVMTTHVTRYAPWEEGADEPENLGTDTTTETVEPDDDETVAGYIAERIRKAGATEPSDTGRMRAHGWYSDPDGYEHPYTGIREELSVHMSGADWTDSLAADVASLVAQPWPVPLGADGRPYVMPAYYGAPADTAAKAPDTAADEPAPATGPDALPCGCVPHVTRMSPFGTAVYCVTEENAYCNFECPHYDDDDTDGA